MSEKLLPAPPLDEPETAAEPGWLPIREVARQTGVNPVTLRAWERRYGLILPRRTPKGHRLYNDAHVARIHAVLAWLNRGVAVGQVRDLLDREPPTDAEAAPDSPWQILQMELLAAIEALASRRLDALFDQAGALYPAPLLCERLLQPLLAELERRERAGAGLERAFFLSWLRTRLAARVQQHSRQNGGAPLLLAGLAGQPIEPGLWLCAWLATAAGSPLEVLDGPASLTELELALPRLAPCGLLLHATQPLTAVQLRQLERLVRGSRFPVLLAGPAAAAQREPLSQLPGLLLAEDPPAALQLLQNLPPAGHGEPPCAS
ncbi:MerR family transcriptional regulator [Azotobacter salinestris]|uniref:MerR family transcriptional regulator n=1 Tax=Azotobacter salinestris TaxID=69964 RepID=UPI0032DE46A8